MAQPAMLGPDGVATWTGAGADRPPGGDVRLRPDPVGGRCELMDGSLLITQLPNDQHQSVADRVMTVLAAAAPKGWRAIREIGVRVPGGDLIPDVAVLYPHAERGVTWRAPDDVALIVEVESPSSRRYDRTVKPEYYAEAGIPGYWRIELHVRAVSVYVHELAGDGYRLSGTATVTNSYEVASPYPLTIDPAALVS